MKCAAQGDLLLRRIDKLPDDIVKAESERGRLVLAHSETGHCHVVLERPEVSLYSFSELISYLQVSGDEPVELQHERAFDTHETIAIPPGIYELRRQREYVPNGWRKAAD
jgi:hypothetical protein